jgi:hypothetical protein
MANNRNSSSSSNRQRLFIHFDNVYPRILPERTHTRNSASRQHDVRQRHGPQCSPPAVISNQNATQRGAQKHLALYLARHQTRPHRKKNRVSAL